MSFQVKSALKDVAPGLIDPPPSQLVSYCDRLYGRSLQKPLTKALEIGRYHICAYLTVERYMDQLNLPSPEHTRIPIPPKAAIKTINEFRFYLDQVKSATSTPRKRKVPETPTKSAKYNSPDPSPSKQYTPLNLNIGTSRSPSKSSPLRKQFEALADKDSEDISTPTTPEANPFVSTPKKSKARSNYPSLTIPRLIQVCNRFYIPPPITVKIIQSFVDQQHKFIKKNTWYLGVGLVYATSLRINHRLAQKKPGFNDMLLSQLARLDHGLTKPNISYWCSTINDTVQYQPWILEIEDIYRFGVRSAASVQKELEAKLGPSYKVYDDLGAMVNSHTDLSSESQEKYYNTWSNAVLSHLQ